VKLDAEFRLGLRQMRKLVEAVGLKVSRELQRANRSAKRAACNALRNVNCATCNMQRKSCSVQRAA
jgi:hypothetical protein